MYTIKLNDLRIFSVLENLKYLLKEFQFIMSLKIRRSMAYTDTNDVTSMYV